MSHTSNTPHARLNLSAVDEVFEVVHQRFVAEIQGCRVAQSHSLGMHPTDISGNCTLLQSFNVIRVDVEMTDFLGVIRDITNYSLLTLNCSLTAILSHGCYINTATEF